MPSSSRIASGEKYRTAEGLPSSRPLSSWMRAIASAFERIAGEAVEPVGREDGDAAGRRSSARARRPHRVPDHHPARSRPGRRRVSTRSNPARRAISATVAAWPAPTSSAIAGCLEVSPCAIRPSSSSIASSPSARRRAPRAARTRVISGRQPRPLVLGHIGEVGEDEIDAPAGTAPRTRHARSSPSRSALAPATSSAAGDVSVAATRARREARRRPRARPRRSRCRRRARSPARARARPRPAARSPGAGSAPDGRRSSSMRRKPLRPRM